MHGVNPDIFPEIGNSGIFLLRHTEKEEEDELCIVPSGTEYHQLLCGLQTLSLQQIQLSWKSDTCMCVIKFQ